METVPTPYTGYNLGSAFTKVMKNYFTFSGRATRSEFWFFQLAYVLITIVLALCDIIFFPGLINDYELFFSLEIFAFVIFFPSLALDIRRLHDIGKSGWNVLWYEVPYMIIITAEAFFKNCSDILSLNGAAVSEKTSKAAETLARSWNDLWCLWYVIPMLIFLIFWCKDSQKGTNKYGPSEKYPSA